MEVDRSVSADLHHTVMKGGVNESKLVCPKR